MTANIRPGSRIMRGPLVAAAGRSGPRSIQLALGLLLALLAACVPDPAVPPTATTAPPAPAGLCGDARCIAPETQATCPQDCAPAAPRFQPDANQQLVYLAGESGDLALLLTFPAVPRYEDGAGVVVEVAPFLTPSRSFYQSVAVEQAGLIHVAYFWPGLGDPQGVHSEGAFDAGGPAAIAALRDVIRFAAGELPDRDGRTLSELAPLPVAADNLGLYAFSHPGMAAVSVLAAYGRELRAVGYLVGRENPTDDTTCAVEIGYWGRNGQPVANPLYSYPQSYGPHALTLDYTGLRWDPAVTQDGSEWVGRPYFDLDGDGQLGPADHVLGPRVPSSNDRRLYSIALTRALADLHLDPWPADIATPQEAAAVWGQLLSPPRYPELGDAVPLLKVMLVFARQDHVQVAPDKPHIHQAYDGLANTAGLWTRLNPDAVYAAWAAPFASQTFPDNPANSEPADWSEIGRWAYSAPGWAAQLIPLAAVAEMADRLHEDEWRDNLAHPLVSFESPSPPDESLGSAAGRRP